MAPTIEPILPPRLLGLHAEGLFLPAETPAISLLCAAQPTVLPLELLLARSHQLLKNGVCLFSQSPCQKMMGRGIKSEDFTIEDRAGGTATDPFQTGKQTCFRDLWGVPIFCGGLSAYILELVQRHLKMKFTVVMTGKRDLWGQAS